jgi:hypothetical protein
MNEVYVICSESGDEYKLQFTTERSGMIADEILDELQNSGIEVVEVGLGRNKGLNVTSHLVLAQIEQCIAEVVLNHSNVMLVFFCDFISLLPSMRRDVSVQEYRSRLFCRMFERYVSQHRIHEVCNKIFVVEGVAENYFFHVIAHKDLIGYADIVGNSIQKDFGK